MVDMRVSIVSEIAEPGTRIVAPYWAKSTFNYAWNIQIHIHSDRQVTKSIKYLIKPDS